MLDERYRNLPPITSFVCLVLTDICYSLLYITPHLLGLWMFQVYQINNFTTMNKVDESIPYHRETMVHISTPPNRRQNDITSC